MPHILDIRNSAFRSDPAANTAGDLKLSGRGLIQLNFECHGRTIKPTASVPKLFTRPKMRWAQRAQSATCTSALRRSWIMGRTRLSRPCTAQRGTFGLRMASITRCSNPDKRCAARFTDVVRPAANVDLTQAGNRARECVPSVPMTYPLVWMERYYGGCRR